MQDTSELARKYRALKRGLRQQLLETGKSIAQGLRQEYQGRWRRFEERIRVLEQQLEEARRRGSEVAAAGGGGPHGGKEKGVVLAGMGGQRDRGTHGGEGRGGEGVALGEKGREVLGRRTGGGAPRCEGQKKGTREREAVAAAHGGVDGGEKEGVGAALGGKRVNGARGRVEKSAKGWVVLEPSRFRVIEMKRWQDSMDEEGSEGESEGQEHRRKCFFDRGGTLLREGEEVGRDRGEGKGVGEVGKQTGEKRAREGDGRPRIIRLHDAQGGGLEGSGGEQQGEVKRQAASSEPLKRRRAGELNGREEEGQARNGGKVDEPVAL